VLPTLRPFSSPRLLYMMCSCIPRWRFGLALFYQILVFPFAAMAELGGNGGGAAAAERTLWVKKEGDPRFFKLRSTAADADDLIKEIVKEMPSLRDTDLSTLTVHVARDEEGKDLGAALDSTASASEALPTEAGKIIRLVIKAAAPAPRGELFALLCAVPVCYAPPWSPMSSPPCLLRCLARLLCCRRWRSCRGWSRCVRPFCIPPLCCMSVLPRVRRDAQASPDVRDASPCRRR